MKDEVLLDFSRSLFHVYEIPIRILRNGKQIAIFENFSLLKETDDFLFRGLMKKFNEDGRNVDVLISENMLAYGYIRNKESDTAMLIGPTRSIPTNENAVRKIAERAELPKGLYKNLYEYISSIHILQLKRFLHMMVCLHEAINGEVVGVETFYSSDHSYTVNEEAQKGLVEHTEKVAYEFTGKIDYYDSEQRILFYIVNGMTEQVKIFWQEADVDSFTADDADTLRIVKNACIVSIAIITRAVLASDLSPEEIYFLRDAYVFQAEMCKSVPEVLKLRYNVILDFTERIRRLHCAPSDNPLVNRIISFVQQNVEKRITQEELAEKFHTNKAYLCRKFHEETGIRLNEYIHRQKINEAKRLLQFTSQPLIEIAHHLSYSSQSHFQKVFKEIEGITPLEYRNKKLFE